MATKYPTGLSPTQGEYPGTYAPQARQGTQRVLKFAEYLYQFDGTEAASDIILLGLGSSNSKFPKGTELFPQLSYFYVETDCATTLTLDCGDLDGSASDAAYPNGDAYAVAHIDDDADRYADGVDAGAVGVDVFASGVAASIPHILQEDAFFTVTFATIGSPVATGVLRIRIAYFEA